MKTYHIGLLKAGKKLIIQMAGAKDNLSCETWIYYGRRETTKQRVKELKGEILTVVNEVKHTDFKTVAVV